MFINKYYDYSKNIIAKRIKFSSIENDLCKINALKKYFVTQEEAMDKKEKLLKQIQIFSNKKRRFTPLY